MKQLTLQIFLLFTLSLPAFATQGDKQQAPLTENAQLQAVTKGIFSLNQDQSIDLTDRSLLMTFLVNKRCPAVSINGRTLCIKKGDHFDFIRSGGNFLLGDLFKDKKRCFLDVVGIETPQGADATATFRLYCA